MLDLSKLNLPKTYDELAKHGQAVMQMEGVLPHKRPKMEHVQDTDYCHDAGRASDGNQLFCRMDPANLGCGYKDCTEIKPETLLSL